METVDRFPEPRERSSMFIDAVLDGRVWRVEHDEWSGRYASLASFRAAIAQAARTRGCRVRFTGTSGGPVYIQSVDKDETP